VRLYLKQTLHKKRACGVAGGSSMVMCKALGSISSTQAKEYVKQVYLNKLDILDEMHKLLEKDDTKK
jgi:hypothetical protein